MIFLMNNRNMNNLKYQKQYQKEKVVSKEVTQVSKGVSKENKHSQ